MKWIEKQTTQKTKKLCKEWATKVLADALIGVSPDQTKLIPFFDMWYETYKRHSVGQDHRNKIKATKKYIIEFFGDDICLHQLDRIKYQQFINYLGGADNLNLAVSTVRDHHKIFKACLYEAQDNGLIISNPARSAKIVGRDTSGEKKKTLTLGEWKKLLEAVLNANNCSSKFATITMMFTGARFQEINGLKTSDVNFKEDTIRINKAFDYKRTKSYTPTKNAGSKRTVDMPELLSSILREYIYDLRKDCKIIAINSESEKDIFLFPNELDTPITNKAINKFITRQCKKANIERITSHAFRHAKTDMLVLAGTDMVYTQKQLGHSDPATTLKYYSELNMDIREKNKKIQESFLTSNIL